MQPRKSLAAECRIETTHLKPSKQEEQGCMGIAEIVVNEGETHTHTHTHTNKKQSRIGDSKCTSRTSTACLRKARVHEYMAEAGLQERRGTDLAQSTQNPIAMKMTTPLEKNEINRMTKGQQNIPKPYSRRPQSRESETTRRH